MNATIARKFNDHGGVLSTFMLSTLWSYGVNWVCVVVFKFFDYIVTVNIIISKAVGCDLNKRRVPRVEQELLTFQEHLSLSPVFSMARIGQSLVFCQCFEDYCLSFVRFIVCLLIYGFWLPLWYFQTYLTCTCCQGNIMTLTSVVIFSLWFWVWNRFLYCG